MCSSDLIHPLVRSSFEIIAKSAPSGAIVINQIPLLVETDGAKNFDYVITVSSTIENRKERLRKKGMLDSDIDARIAAQANDVERRAISDFEIINDSDLASLEKQVVEVFNRLRTDASNN